jgi:hypothetical protein
MVTSYVMLLKVDFLSKPDIYWNQIFTKWVMVKGDNMLEKEKENKW